MGKYQYDGIAAWIEQLMRDKESDDLEFKSAAGGFPGSFWETYSSFANTDGGTIVLGVKENAGGFSADDLSAELIEKYSREFWCNVNNREKISRNLLSNDDVRQLDFEGHPFLVFYIPRASREERPVHCTPNPYNGTYKRNNEGDFKCTEQEVRRMFADANVESPADSRILENYSFDDIDKTSLDQYRRMFDLAKPGHAWLALDDMGLLKKLGAYRVDRKTGKEGFTVAGMLMFGKTEAITDEECTPFFFPDYRELSANSSEQERWIDRVYPDGLWEANVFQFYRRTVAKLQEGLPVPFRLEGDMRKDETPAHVAIREALINTLIHADYSVNSSIVITKSRDSIEFSNPGSLLVSKQQYYEGGLSVCRNTSLQKMFMMLGRAEKAGSGADTIVNGWVKSNRTMPDIRQGVRPDKVTLTLSMASFVDEKAQKQLCQLFGDNVLEIEHNRLAVLYLALLEGRVSNERLRYSLNMHKYDISQMLRSMCDGGLLIPEGFGRGTYYRLPDNVASNVASNIVSNVASNAGASHHNGAVKKRMSREELFGVIQEAADDWLSLSEIASKVERSKQYLNNSVIPLMITLGLLERKDPMNPKSADQKYRSKRQVSE